MHKSWPWFGQTINLWTSQINHEKIPTGAKHIQPRKPRKNQPTSIIYHPKLCMIQGVRDKKPMMVKNAGGEINTDIENVDDYGTIQNTIVPTRFKSR